MVSKAVKPRETLAMERSLSRLQQTPIAIVGMASLFPKAENLQAYWDNILNEVDCITDVPASRWNVDDYYDPNPRAEDKTYCKRGGFIPDIDFNPMEFGLPPMVLEATDVSQLLALVLAKWAMEDAGYGRSRDFNRANTGVTLGTVSRLLATPLGARLQFPLWEKVLGSCGLSQEATATVIDKFKALYIDWQENSFPGMLSNVIAGRIANRFDFGGLNCTLDAACASSLAALKMALSELVEHRADMMLTGGIDPDNSAFTYLCFSKTPALSLKQQSRPFDAESDGILLGEGLGMVVLKRLADAERDGDRIYAVIKGIGTSSDGRFKSIYAPRAAGQVQALKRAYEDADVSPATVGLIEAHGTGTMAGDPVEFASLNEVFKSESADQSPIALGSVKSQIGHTKTAAGVASLIKCSLALYHKILPPTINVDKPSAKLDIESSPFYLNTKLRPWIRQQGEPPRRAGVSSFGFGGTNFHVVLEEYEADHTSSYRLQPVPQPCMLSAATPAALLQHCQTVLAALESDTGQQTYIQLVRSSKTIEIPQTDARIGFVATDLAEAHEHLGMAVSLLKTQQSEAWETPQGVYYRATGLNLQGKVVALFSGQGSQYLDMGQHLAANFPQLRETYGQLDSLLVEAGQQPVSQVVFPLPVFDEAAAKAQGKVLKQTEYAQPAIGAFSSGLYKILQQAGFTPSFVAGHSFGELTALWAAGVLSDADYCSLVKSRGQAMAAPADPTFDAGTMLAVKGDAKRVEALVKAHSDVKIANFNSNKQVVLAGAKDAIAQIQKVLETEGFSPIPLPVSAAFHTELVAHAQQPFSQAVKQVTFSPTRLPVYSNVTGTPYPKKTAAMKTLLQEHMVSQVQFKQTIENIYNAGGYCFVEFGPKNVLTNLVKDILGNRPHLSIALNASRHKNSDRQLREAVLQLRVAGLPLTSFDPYEAEFKLPEPFPKGQQLTVRLGGCCHTSEKTKQKMHAALNESVPMPAAAKPAIPNGFTPISSPGKNGHRNGASNGARHRLENGNGVKTSFSTNGSTAVADISALPLSPTQPHVPANSAMTNSMTVQSIPKKSGPAPAVSPSPAPTADKSVLRSLDHTVAQFGQHQSNILRVHEQYLENHRLYTQAFLQLTEQQQGNGKSSASADPSMMQFHDHQRETLRVHERYLTHQIDCSKTFFQLGQQVYGGSTVPAELAAPVSQPNGLSSQSVVTPEPAVIESSTMAPATDEMPALPIVNLSPEIPVEPAPPAEPEPTQPAIAKSTPAAVEENSIAATVDLAELGNTLLSVVSEKTGYPTEMLELDMDMEADLGIDSIKRVEILGALQDAYPDLPQPSLEDLAEIEMRTLGQVTKYMQSLIPGSSDVSASDAAPLATAEPMASPIPEAVVAISPVSKPASTETDPAVDPAELQQTLLTVVSEKTGYPTEMLELDMDMEADLGIDSIKRVEILGALQDLFPQLPQPNLEDLAEIEMRTLEQVTGYMHSLVGQKKTLVGLSLSGQR